MAYTQAGLGTEGSRPQAASRSTATAQQEYVWACRPPEERSHCWASLCSAFLGFGLSTHQGSFSAVKKEATEQTRKGLGLRMPQLRRISVPWPALRRGLASHSPLRVGHRVERSVQKRDSPPALTIKPHAPPRKQNRRIRKVRLLPPLGVTAEGPAPEMKYRVRQALSFGLQRRGGSIPGGGASAHLKVEPLGHRLRFPGSLSVPAEWGIEWAGLESACSECKYSG